MDWNEAVGKMESGFRCPSIRGLHSLFELLYTVQLSIILLVTTPSLQPDGDTFRDIELLALLGWRASRCQSRTGDRGGGGSKSRLIKFQMGVWMSDFRAEVNELAKWPVFESKLYEP